MTRESESGREREKKKKRQRREERRKKNEDKGLAMAESRFGDELDVAKLNSKPEKDQRGED